MPAFFLPGNETLSDYFEKFERLDRSNSSTPEPSLGGEVGDVATWGSAGGVAGFVLLLASAVVVARRYFGAFEQIAQSISSLLAAITAVVRRRNEPEAPPEIPMRAMPRNLTDEERLRAERAQRLAHCVQGQHLYSLVNESYRGPSWI